MFVIANHRICHRRTSLRLDISVGSSACLEIVPPPLAALSPTCAHSYHTKPCSHFRWFNSLVVCKRLPAHLRPLSFRHRNIVSKFCDYALTFVHCFATLNPTAASSSPTITPFFYAPITLKFNGGPTSYIMNFPADGNERLTSLPPSFLLPK